jgi:hypothetical protein
MIKKKNFIHYCKIKSLTIQKQKFLKDTFSSKMFFFIFAALILLAVILGIIMLVYDYRNDLFFFMDIVLNKMCKILQELLSFIIEIINKFRGQGPTPLIHDSGEAFGEYDANFAKRPEGEKDFSQPEIALHMETGENNEITDPELKELIRQGIYDPKTDRLYTIKNTWKDTLTSEESKDISKNEEYWNYRQWTSITGVISLMFKFRKDKCVNTTQTYNNKSQSKIKYKKEIFTDYVEPSTSIFEKIWKGIRSLFIKEKKSVACQAYPGENSRLHERYSRKGRKSKKGQSLERKIAPKVVNKKVTPAVDDPKGKARVIEPEPEGVDLRPLNQQMDITKLDIDFTMQKINVLKKYRRLSAAEYYAFFTITFTPAFMGNLKPTVIDLYNTIVVHASDITEKEASALSDSVMFDAMRGVLEKFKQDPKALKDALIPTIPHTQFEELIMLFYSDEEAFNKREDVNRLLTKLRSKMVKK